MWTFAIEQPDEIQNYGYDATIWKWRLISAATGATTETFVFVSGTAMAMDDAYLPAVVVRAKATRGREVIEPYLDWVVPPRRIELATNSNRPRTTGGVRSPADADPRALQELVKWFADRGVDLEIDRRGDDWAAVSLPRGVRVGVADFGTGPSPLDAALDARRRYERSQHPLVPHREF